MVSFFKAKPEKETFEFTLSSYLSKLGAYSTVTQVNHTQTNFLSELGGNAEPLLYCSFEILYC